MIFLGGTCGDNDWRRERAIPLLRELGVPASEIFDPVVDDWDEAAQAREDAAKRDARFVLFYIGNPRAHDSEVSAYSLVEAVMALYDQPARAVVVFGPEEFSPGTAKHLRKCEMDLRRRFPEGAIFASLDHALRAIAGEYTA
ncbi:MAG TPA: nucleoside 2-deoxyribosyltransferase domain-containing protein [Gemmatimonadaceae bacterium]